MRVLGGVPGHLVDAVQDPGELPGAMVQQAVEAHAELGCLDLARVGRAHGRDVIGEMQAGLQEADLAVVLDALEAESLRRQTQLAQQPGREIALEGDVVDRLHGRRTLSAGERQIGRGQPGMPVVGMNHVGTPIEEPPETDLGAQPTQSGEATGVVAPVPAVRPEIGTRRPGEEVRRIDREDRHARRGTAGDEPRRPAEQIVDGNRRFRRPESFENAGIGRKENLDVDAQPRERHRQGAAHVGQPAGLDQREQLGRDEKDLHSAVPRYLIISVIPTEAERSEAQWRDLFCCFGDKMRSLDYAAPWAASLGMTETR